MSSALPLTPRVPGNGSMLRLLPGVLLIALLLLIFRDTVAEMIATYDRSETFAHAYLVPPITLWLIWRQRHALAPLAVQPQPWLLVLIAGASLLWLVGELAVVNVATQLALVSLIILFVPALYGWPITRAILFPLLFLYFAVPMGLVLVPVMMEQTADFTIMALRASGIPVYREGLQFVIPSGNWSVVEACSGVRYLIASFMVGTLFAYLNYRTWQRRLGFILVSIAVPVVANWLRAYMIVMLGHFSGNKLAVGVDHLVYGWVFFGLVIGLMFMIGSRWAQANDPPGPGQAGPAAASDAVSSRGIWLTAAGVTVLLLAVQGAQWLLERPRADALQALRLPDDLAGGWHSTEQPITAWVPAYGGTRSSEQRSYAGSDGQRAVGVWAGYYREQGRTNKMVTANNSLSRVEETNWAQVSSSTQRLNIDGRDIALRSALMRGPGEPGSPSAQRLLVWQLYWLGGEQLTTSDARAKLMLAFNRLRGLGDDSAALMFYTPAGTSHASLAAAEATLRDVVGANLGPITDRLRTLEKGSAAAKP